MSKTRTIAPYMHITTDDDGHPAIKTPGVLTSWGGEASLADWPLRATRNARTARRIAGRHIRRGAINAWPIDITVGCTLPADDPEDDQ